MEQILIEKIVTTHIRAIFFYQWRNKARLFNINIFMYVFYNKKNKV